MKIELPNGITIHLDSGEEIAAVLPMLRPGDPAPAPRATTEEEAVDPGQTIPLFVKDGVTAIYYRHPDVPRRAVVQVYGECRNMTDHLSDRTGFLDITGQLYR